MSDLQFWSGRKVFITGHTGFKGSWLSRILVKAGAEVTGYALLPSTDESLFDICKVEDSINSVIGDIRDMDALERAFKRAKPEFVIHAAAQPLVKESYKRPAYTFETNVLGTVNTLECIRLTGGVESFLNITTDKVYKESGLKDYGYKESDELGGFDPYSNSKSCSELVTECYKNSFFTESLTAISTARAGNVIGGGDFAKDRIIPDCVRAAKRGETIVVRNPNSTRPYQHVLEPLFAYLLILQRQYKDKTLADCYNVGPNSGDSITTGMLVDMFCSTWGHGLEWKSESVAGPHEANYLKLDCSKIADVLGWQPKWDAQKAIEKTVEWELAYSYNEDIARLMDNQIEEYIEQ